MLFFLSLCAIAFKLLLNYSIAQTDLLDPLIDQRLSRRRFPIFLEIGVAIRTESAPAMMTKATFQWLITCIVKLTKIVLQKRTTIPRELIRSKRSFTAFEGGRKHTKRELRRDL
jgi:hypothetical protein